MKGPITGCGEFGIALAKACGLGERMVKRIVIDCACDELVTVTATLIDFNGDEIIETIQKYDVHQRPTPDPKQHAEPQQI
jgi:hypothetical protein